ncbi:MAG: phosphatidate cytidylyltransferase [Thermoleophilaceae bacterium]|nr:phosphatidate cytidylyltransferase [Thermoleophilaceae bacterium]
MASRRRRGGGSDVAARVLAAIPAIAFAIFIVAQGGLVFAIGLIPLALIGLHELYTMAARVRPVKLAGFLAAIGLILAAHFGDQFQILLVLTVSVAVTFVLSLLRPGRENVSWAIAMTMLGVVWIPLALAHAVLLRELPHGGALVVDVLIGTFIGDTCAYFGGRAWGRRPLAPLISPNKTLEGLLCGIAGGTFAFWLFAFAYQDWIPGGKALLIGFCVALAAPLGDLFESLVKRDLDVKDTGRFFGAHGGVLDRLDAVFFTAVTAYYVSVAVL